MTVRSKRSPPFASEPRVDDLADGDVALRDARLLHARERTGALDVEDLERQRSMTPAASRIAGARR